MKILQYVSIALSLTAVVVTWHGALTRTKTEAHDHGAPWESSQFQKTMQDSSSSKAAPNGAAKDRLACLEKELLQLRNSVRNLGGRLDRVAEISRGDAESPVASNDELDALSEQEEYDGRSRIELIDTSFLAEKTDGDWANDMKNVISEAFAGGRLAGAQLLDAECRTSICRVHVNLDDGESFENLFRELLPQVSEELSGGIVEDGRGENGSRGAVIYFARKGSELPSLP